MTLSEKTPRLQAIRADAVSKDLVATFPPAISIEHWIRYLRSIKVGAAPNVSVLQRRQAHNIGHLLQLLEFECSLLLYDLEVSRKRNSNRSTLHGGVRPFMVHQFAVTALSILEGIGSASAKSADEAIAINRARLESSEWQNAL